MRARFPSGEIMIRGAEFCVPPHIMHLQDTARKLKTTPDELYGKTGIMERRFAPRGNTGVDLGAQAAAKLLDKYPVDKERIGALIVGTFTPASFLPAMATHIAERLSLSQNTFPFDLNAACASGAQGLIEAAHSVAMGDAEYALVIAVDTATHAIDWNETKGVAPLLGDGASAVLLGRGSNKPDYTFPEMSIVGYQSGCDYALSSAITLRTQFPCEELDTRDFFIRMNGRAVYYYVTTHVPVHIQETLAYFGKSLDDIALLVPHHANGRMTKKIAERLGITPEAVFSDIEKYGNTSSAGTLLPFADAINQEKIRERLYPGKLVVLASFGAGITWQVILIEVL